MISPKSRTGLLSAHHPSAAFLLEAILLMAVTVAALAVFVGLYASSYEMTRTNLEKQQAIALARSYAEEFSADPESLASTTVPVDNLSVTCSVVDDKRSSGTLWRANIIVRNKEGVVLCDVTTSKWRGAHHES